MNDINKTNFFYFCFLLLIIFSLIQGYYCKYFSFRVCNEFFKNYWTENGFIENLQVIFVLTSIILLIKVKFKLKKFNFIHIFIILKIFALTYYLGEEISWGQHFFKWNSPVIFQEINNQKETNLHNISNLFDQLPRTLVMLWCIFCPLIFLLLKKFMSLNIFIIRPTFVLSYISILLFLLIGPDLLIDKLNLHPGHVDQFGKDIHEAKFYDLITFNFIRLSELHELIFSFYFFIYSYSLSKLVLMTRKIY